MPDIPHSGNHLILRTVGPSGPNFQVDARPARTFRFQVSGFRFLNAARPARSAPRLRVSAVKSLSENWKGSHCARRFRVVRIFRGQNPLHFYFWSSQVTFGHIWSSFPGFCQPTGTPKQQALRIFRQALTAQMRLLRDNPETDARAEPESSQNCRAFRSCRALPPRKRKMVKKR
jgi:hypothetical protein